MNKVWAIVSMGSLVDSLKIERKIMNEAVYWRILAHPRAVERGACAQEAWLLLRWLDMHRQPGTRAEYYRMML